LAGKRRRAHEKNLGIAAGGRAGEARHMGKTATPQPTVFSELLEWRVVVLIDWRDGSA